MRWLKWPEPARKPTPITDTLTSAALILGMRPNPMAKNGWLGQAEIILEIAHRIRLLEEK